MLLSLAFVVMAVVAVERQQVLSRAFRGAMAKSGLSLKEAAGHMGENFAQLHRELEGVGHLSMTRIVTRMPEAFVQWFALDLASAVGLPHEVQIGRQIAERAQ